MGEQHPPGVLNEFIAPPRPRMHRLVRCRRGGGPGRAGCVIYVVDPPPHHRPVCVDRPGRGRGQRRPAKRAVDPWRAVHRPEPRSPIFMARHPWSLCGVERYAQLIPPHCQGLQGLEMLLSLLSSGYYEVHCSSGAVARPGERVLVLCRASCLWDAYCALALSSA